MGKLKSIGKVVVTGICILAPIFNVVSEFTEEKRQEEKVRAIVREELNKAEEEA